MTTIEYKVQLLLNAKRDIEQILNMGQDDFISDGLLETLYTISKVLGMNDVE